jgi:hypothetical protein
VNPLAIVPEQSEKVIPQVLALAEENGLVCFDPRPARFTCLPTWRRNKATSKTTNSGAEATSHGRAAGVLKSLDPGAKRQRQPLESIAEAWVVPDYSLALSDANLPGVDDSAGGGHWVWMGKPQPRRIARIWGGKGSCWQ